MHRHVRKLHLTCIRDSDATHGRVLLEDALRTASLGDETRLIVVRRLDLGELPARSSATAWSLRLEETFRAQRPAAVRFDHPAADRAEAVYFPHRYEAYLALAERGASGDSCHAWYWRAALPGWSPAFNPVETLRFCFHALAETGGLELTLILALRLKARGRLTSLLGTLQAADLTSLQADLAPFLPAPGTADISSSRTSSSPPPEPFATRAESAFAADWGAADPRTRWLAAVAIAHRAGFNPEFTLAPPAPSPALVQQVVLRWTEERRPRPSPPPPAGDAPRPAEVRGDDGEPAPDDPAPTARRASADDPAFTQAGGLFFVIPLLARAGLPTYLRTLAPDDRTALPWQIFRLLLRHARIPAHDPLAIALATTRATRVPLGRWLLAANRQLLALTGMNLRTLVRRPALFMLSPTHLDVMFRPGEADIRLRCAALDIDPGWTPWLGRVVTFHYNRED